MAPILTLSYLTKRVPGVTALDDVSFALEPGTVTALIGENGAGKSTIVKILTGIYQPDGGGLALEGRAIQLNSARDAWDAGIAAIHQDTVMFDELSVAEIVFMGHMPGGRLGDWAQMRRRTGDLLARSDAGFDADTPLKRLSVAEKHMVEVARALSHDARVVIMDEPTAALSRNEIDELFGLVETLKAEGRAILFISHKFDEIFRVSDAWVCLRDGQLAGAGRTAEATEAELVRLMVGRPVDQVFPKRKIALGDTVLAVEGLGNATEFADLTFDLRRGEILGFYGRVGAGRPEAMQCLFGICRAGRGRVTLDGKTLNIRAPSDAIRAGLAYVPEDRQVQGAALPMTIRENTTLASLRDHASGPFLSARSERAATRQLGQRLDVRAASWETAVGDLSGGNQQ